MFSLLYVLVLTRATTIPISSATDKMARLEQRIERFDDVLKHTTASSSELEAALLALDQGLASSPRTPVAT